MKVNNNLLAVIAGIIVCSVVVFYCPSIQGSQRTYEVQPQVSIPEYRTDAARAIDAYERLMERYMDLTERNLFGIGADVRVIAKRLDSIDSELKRLSTRMTEIEKALGNVQLQPAVGQESQPDTKRRENP